MLDRNYMKKNNLVLMIVCMFSPLVGATFKFEHPKKDGYCLKESFLQQIRDAFKVDTFIETGTYEGATTRIAAHLFGSIHSIEYDWKNFINAQNTLGAFTNVHLHQGDSGKVLKEVVRFANGTTFFWLDAHSDEFIKPRSLADTKICTPIMEELAAIKEYANHNHSSIIMIDDIRHFASVLDGEKLVESWSYTLDDIVEKLREINENFEIVVMADSLLAYDKNIYSIELSPILKACTKSRLFNGTNLSEGELLEAESIIAKAVGTEYECIKYLYEHMTFKTDPGFHYNIWYGLICLKRAEYQKAYDALLPVVTKKSYTHPRIYSYLAKASHGLGLRN